MNAGLSRTHGWSAYQRWSQSCNLPTHKMRNGLSEESWKYAIAGSCDFNYVCCIGLENGAWRCTLFCTKYSAIKGTWRNSFGLGPKLKLYKQTSYQTDSIARFPLHECFVCLPNTQPLRSIKRSILFISLWAKIKNAVALWTQFAHLNILQNQQVIIMAGRLYRWESELVNKSLANVHHIQAWKSPFPVTTRPLSVYIARCPFIRTSKSTISIN